MRRETKFLFSFMPFTTYDKEKNRLKEQRQKGWQVQDCSLLGYSLSEVREEEKEYQFIMSKDYQGLRKISEEEWILLCSSPVLHIFEGDKDASSFQDHWTLYFLEEYRKKCRRWGITAAVSALLFIVFLLLVITDLNLPGVAVNFAFFMLSLFTGIVAFTLIRWIRTLAVITQAKQIVSTGKE